MGHIFVLLLLLPGQYRAAYPGFFDLFQAPGEGRGTAAKRHIDRLGGALFLFYFSALVTHTASRAASKRRPRQGVPRAGVGFEQLTAGGPASCSPCMPAREAGQHPVQRERHLLTGPKRVTVPGYDRPLGEACSPCGAEAHGRRRPPTPAPKGLRCGGQCPAWRLFLYRTARMPQWPERRAAVRSTAVTLPAASDEPRGRTVDASHPRAAGQGRTQGRDYERPAASDKPRRLEGYAAHRASGVRAERRGLFPVRPRSAPLALPDMRERAQAYGQRPDHKTRGSYGPELIYKTLSGEKPGTCPDGAQAAIRSQTGCTRISRPLAAQKPITAAAYAAKRVPIRNKTGQARLRRSAPWRPNSGLTAARGSPCVAQSCAAHRTRLCRRRR